MRKRFCVDKTDLNKEVKIFNILLLIFIVSPFIYSQVPINGFCGYKSFKTQESFNSIFSLNYNGDSYTDFLLFNTTKKTIQFYKGEQNNEFKKDYTLSVPYDITRIQSLYDPSNRVKGYVFTSRRNRCAGIYSFNEEGKLKIIDKIEFSSYPENISIGNINNNQENEILISGSAFNGLSVLHISNTILIEKKIIEGASYSNAIFADLTGSGYKDIAAFNLLNSSLDFYYNNSYGEFENVRSIPIYNGLTSLQSTDFDLDKNEDLVFITGNQIKILYGDFTSSYDTSLTIETKYHPDNFILGDYNKDGKTDIAYFNYDEGIVSILFFKNKKNFYDEIIYLNKKGIQKIIPFYSKFVNGIAAVSEKQSVYLLSNINNFTEDVNISLGGEPIALNYFDYNFNGINDICFIDNFTKSLNLIVRNSNGIPSEFYSTPLYENYNEIEVIEKDKGNKTFYCYSRGKKLVEVIFFDIKNKKFDKRSLYASGRIKDLKIKKMEDESNRIYIASINDGVLSLNIYQYKDFRYTVKNYLNIRKNIIDVSIIINNELQLYYWVSNKDSLELVKTFPGHQKTESKSVYKMQLEDNYFITSISGDLFNSGSESIISFINLIKNNITVINTDNFTRRFYNSDFNILNKNDLYFGKFSPDGLNQLTYLNTVDNTLNLLNFIKEGREFFIKRLQNNIKIKDYFIKNMNSKESHLVYIDSKENCISIKKII